MLRIFNRFSILCLIFLFFFFGSSKGQADNSKLTLEWISLKSYKSVGKSPSGIFWSEDGNVLVQGTMRLVQRLIELKKDTWDCHLYPLDGHG